MSSKESVKKTCARFGKDRTRMMDIVEEVQKQSHCVSHEAIDLIAAEVNVPRVDVEGTVSFYSFLSRTPKGKIVIRVCNDTVDRMKGAGEVAEAFSQALGIPMGETTPDGAFSLEWTPCIGMCDQAPSAMIDDVIVNSMTADKARKIVSTLKSKGDPKAIVDNLGDGNNANKLVHSMVWNNVRQKGEVIFSAYETGSGLKKALAMTPVEVIRDIKTSRLRGRGGAGFPTGMKWEFTRKAEGASKYVICNADEGEPGTFKDRAVLTERADMLFEGMTIAGYAIGAEHGILYLRGEYAYLRAFLEDVLRQRREQHLLGKDVCGHKGMHFDIRIQLGAGAYVCGEETALISSCEGLRGDPKNRPPFPAQKGYLQSPTSVNNVETFCCAARILDKGPGWFAQTGSKGSPGTKLLSVSGDCARPGIYEVPFGIKLADLLATVEATSVGAVQIGGPSGQLVGPADFHRTICYDDLATGGAVIIFDKTRDLLKIAAEFMDFFADESCGYCTPCRVGNTLIKERLEHLIAGKATAADLDYLQQICGTIKTASRCGLGQTSPNPVLSLLKNFRPLMDKHAKAKHDEFLPAFDIKAALTEAGGIAGRGSMHF